MLRNATENVDTLPLRKLEHIGVITLEEVIVLFYKKLPGFKWFRSCNLKNANNEMEGNLEGVSYAILISTKLTITEKTEVFCNLSTTKKFDTYTLFYFSW